MHLRNTIAQIYIIKVTKPQAGMKAPLSCLFHHISRELGMEQNLQDSVVSKMMTELKSDKAVARANAVKTLANFGLAHKNIIMSLLIPMADDDVSSLESIF